jgi:hypothetical protein
MGEPVVGEVGLPGLVRHRRGEPDVGGLRTLLRFTPQAGRRGPRCRRGRGAWARSSSTSAPSSESRETRGEGGQCPRGHVAGTRRHVLAGTGARQAAQQWPLRTNRPATSVATQADQARSWVGTKSGSADDSALRIPHPSNPIARAGLVEQGARRVRAIVRVHKDGGIAVGWVPSSPSARSSSPRSNAARASRFTLPDDSDVTPSRAVVTATRAGRDCLVVPAC